MTGFVHDLVFGIYPYVAIAVMIVGSILRYEREPFTWRSGSSQLLRRRQLIWGSVLFHLGILVIFFGHLFGLLMPIEVYKLLGIGHSAKQIMAVTVGGIAGIVSLVGATLLLHRRLFDPRIRRTSSFSDIAILVILFVQLLLGMGTAAIALDHLDGYEMLKFMAWSQGIFSFEAGAAGHIVDVHWLFKTHIALGLTIFLLLPFTRLVHMFSAPVRYLWRPGYQIVRSRRRPVQPAE